MTNCKLNRNYEKDGIEIKFDAMPSYETRQKIKSNGFRWARYRKLWYAKYTDQRWELAQEICNSGDGMATMQSAQSGTLVKKFNPYREFHHFVRQDKPKNGGYSIPKEQQVDEKELKNGDALVFESEGYIYTGQVANWNQNEMRMTHWSPFEPNKEKTYSTSIYITWKLKLDDSTRVVNGYENRCRGREPGEILSPNMFIRAKTTDWMPHEFYDKLIYKMEASVRFNDQKASRAKKPSMIRKWEEGSREAKSKLEFAKQKWMEWETADPKNAALARQIIGDTEEEAAYRMAKWKGEEPTEGIFKPVEKPVSNPNDSINWDNAGQVEFLWRLYGRDSNVFIANEKINEIFAADILKLHNALFADEQLKMWVANSDIINAEAAFRKGFRNIGRYVELRENVDFYRVLVDDKKYNQYVADQFWAWWKENVWLGSSATEETGSGTEIVAEEKAKLYAIGDIVSIKLEKLGRYPTMRFFNEAIILEYKQIASTNGEWIIEIEQTQDLSKTTVYENEIVFLRKSTEEPILANKPDWNHTWEEWQLYGTPTMFADYKLMIEKAKAQGLFKNALEDKYITEARMDQIFESANIEGDGNTPEKSTIAKLQSLQSKIQKLVAAL